MNFISFIRNLPQQDDLGVSGFLTIAKSDLDFPDTSDPLKLANTFKKTITRKYPWFSKIPDDLLSD